MNASTCSRVIASTAVGIPRLERNAAKLRHASPYVSTVRGDLFSARSDRRKLRVRSSTLVSMTGAVSRAALLVTCPTSVDEIRIMCSSSVVRQGFETFAQVTAGT